MKKYLYNLTALLAVLVFLTGCGAQRQVSAPLERSMPIPTGKSYVIGFYNLENLFDTVHDEGKNDYEYLPDGANQWTETKYRKKLSNMAQVIAYGSENRLGLPHTGVIITLPVPGRSIAEIWKDPAISADRRIEVKEIGLKTLQNLQENGCDWKSDCKPEHIFITADDEVSLIDVERMRFQNTPLAPAKCDKQRERFLSLLD